MITGCHGSFVCAPKHGISDTIRRPLIILQNIVFCSGVYKSWSVPYGWWSAEFCNLSAARWLGCNQNLLHIYSSSLPSVTYHFSQGPKRIPPLSKAEESIAKSGSGLTKWGICKAPFSFDILYTPQVRYSSPVCGILLMLVTFIESGFDGSMPLEVVKV